MIRVGVDATCWRNQRGFGRFTRLLLGSMFDTTRDFHFCLFVDHDPVPEMIRPNVSVVKVQTSATTTEAAVADGSRSILDLLSFRRAVANEPLDVMYFPAVYSWYPTGNRAPVIVTFHDAIAEHFPELVMPMLRGRLLWGAKTWLARKSATRFTTVSFAARDEIVQYFKIDPAKIDVILEAADPIFVPVCDEEIRSSARAQLGLPATARLIMYVGGIAPHKNLIGLLQGYAQAIANPTLDDVDLVFVGDPEGDGFHSNTQELMTMLENDPRLAKRVHFTGFVDDQHLVALYSDAIAVAMPAFSEGFGLPAAEAIACGTPVLASRGGAVEEVVGPAGLYFDPFNVSEIAAAIDEVASDPARLADLRAQCLPRAARTSWAASASAMLDVLERCARPS